MHRLLENIEIQVSANRRKSHGPTFFEMLYMKMCQWRSYYNTPAGNERALTFRPENYGFLDAPRILGYTRRILEEQSPSGPIVAHDIFMAKDLRSWVRVQVQVRLTARQAYFGSPVNHISKRRFQHPRIRHLPQALLDMLDGVVQEHGDDMMDDTRVSVDLLNDGQKLSEATVNLPNESAITSEIRTATEIIRHHNVRIVLDNELVAVRADGANFFAQIDNQWLRYRPIVGVERPFYHIQETLERRLALRDAAHVPKLVGVVVDANKRLYKGVLVEMARHGTLFDIIVRRKQEGREISWPMRQRWAKHIATALAVYHRRGQVYGLLTTLNTGIGLDENGDILLSPSMYYRHPAHTAAGPGLVPPECRTAAFKSGKGQIKPTFDLFQLGSLLWHLYRQQDQQFAKSFCLLAGCPKAESDGCEEHKDPVALPKAGSDVPGFFQEIINLCRHEDPQRRPPAWKIVEMFPSDAEITRQVAATEDTGFEAKKSGPVTRLEEARSLVTRYSLCDICSHRCLDISYFCQTCDYGDYDVCRACFDKGLHCRDRAHVLNEQNVGHVSEHTANQRVIQYSSVGHDGRRSRSVC